MTYENTNSPGAGEPDPEAQRIVSEIEETRSDMGATIDEIGHRLQPQTIADEARQKIREATVGKVERIVDDAGMTAQRTGNNLMETVKQNPVPAALAAMGIGWLALRMRESDNGQGGYGGSYGSGRYGYSDGRYGRPDYRSSGPGSDPMQAARSAAGNVAGTAQDVVGNVTGTAQDVADQAIQGAQQVGSNVQQAAQSAVQGAQYAVQQGQWQAQSTLNQNPLAMAALALGVGAAVGLAIPETRRERELMGEQRDRLVEKASEAATQALDQTESKAQEVGEQLLSAR
jgi:hypothetical protein